MDPASPGAPMTARSPSPLVVVGRSVEDGEPVRLEVVDGVVAALYRDVREPGSSWISAGWLDIQVNGYAGHDPNAAGADAATTAAMVRALWAEGVTGVGLTICTESEPRMLDSLRAVAAACEADPVVAGCVVGIHVEGPAISTEDGPRGAHPRQHVRPPDLDEYRRWQAAAGGRIRMVTLSPEYPGAPDYIRAIVADGLVASVGHTGASGDQIRAAVDAGARWSTHLGNGAHALIRRHPNYIWDQLAEDRLSAGFIFDGHHLPPAFMRTAIRAKGVERTVLVSDAISIAGFPPGDYELWDGTAVKLEPSGRLALKGTPYLAGSASALPACVTNAVRHAGVTLGDAVRTVTANPSRLLGLPPTDGHETLRAGMAANLTVFRHDATSGVEVAATIVAGRLVHGSLD
jgi:N-acetylglucosamine-6-phosphate deacetylase